MVLEFQDNGLRQCIDNDFDVEPDDDDEGEVVSEGNRGSHRG